MRKTVTIFAVVLGLIVLGWFFFLRGGDGAENGIIYRTEKVTKGDVTLSFNASGILQPLTVVDVKSKAGGEVVELSVEEADVVKAGQVIARIDPRDTRASYEQAVADYNSANARRDQSRYQLDMQRVQSVVDVQSAEAALSTAKLRLQTLEARANAQPQLTASAIAQAQAGYDSASKALDQLRLVTIPQTKSQVTGDYNRTSAELDAAKKNNDRYQNLLAKGYVSQAQADTAKSQYEAALASFKNAEERKNRVDDDLGIQVATLEARMRDARAALEAARANSIQVGVSVRDLMEAKDAVKQAEASLSQARANKRQVDVRQSEVNAANAAIVRSRVSRDNAKVQLDSTTVVAPRDGVVVRKYLEEGTIIPPGASLFSEGTALVQIADTSRMYVEVLVDEADVARVKMDQEVRVRLESNPRSPVIGRVSRVNPAAQTANGVTQVKVRVEVEGSRGVSLMPGLNASCEFIEQEQKDVLLVPAQALKREGDKTYVDVMTKPNKPTKREVKVGLAGNSMIQVLEGLKEGEEVVTSAIDVKQIEEQQRKMEEAAQQRNPFSGGTGGGAGGGARTGGGGTGGGGMGGGGQHR